MAGSGRPEASLSAAIATSEEVSLRIADTLVPARFHCASREHLGAIKTSLFGRWPKLTFTPREDISAEDVVFSELLNRRAPAAWLVEAGSAADVCTPLARLSRQCCERGSVLVLTSQLGFDLVLVPRQACTQDGCAFIAFATKVEGVAFISRTIATRRVALVLDLDCTLLESEHLPVQPQGWQDLPWETIQLQQQPRGVPGTARVCRLPDESHHAEEVHAASWTSPKGEAYNFRVRQRLGWPHLRELLARESAQDGKLSVSVLSLGRPLYVQAAWKILDPAGHVIPAHEFPRKVRSGRPDGVSWVPRKTPCVGIGLRDVLTADFNMRLGPVFCADDIPDVYADKYRDSVYAVEPYRPVANPPCQYDADGSVLRSMGDRLLAFWRHCYGGDGGGGAVAQLAAEARRTLRRWTTVPLPGGAGAPWWHAHLPQGQCSLGAALSVQAFMEVQAAKLLLLAGPPAAAPSSVEAAQENDENVAAAEVTDPSAKPLPAAAPHHVLRPSSRQGAASSRVLQPCRMGTELEAPGLSAADWQSAPAVAPPAEWSPAPLCIADPGARVEGGEELAAEPEHVAADEMDAGESVEELLAVLQESDAGGGSAARKRPFGSVAALDTVLARDERAATR